MTIKSITSLIFICIMLAKSGAAATESRPQPSNPDILPQGQVVLNYLASLSTDTPHQILSGQWVSGPAWPRAHSLFVESLQQASGKSVALLGSDYMVQSGSEAPLSLPPSAPEQQSQALTQKLIDHWRAGGLVTLTWLMDNPWYRRGKGDACSTVPAPCVPGNLRDLTRTDNPAGLYFKSGMDEMVAHFQKLQDAGVIVLFRPFNEMNGNWFWWGVQTASSPTQDEFSALWRYVHEYFTKVKKLNNILWVYAPGNSESYLAQYPAWKGIVQPAPYYYPGSQFVDVVGVDYYKDRVVAVSDPSAKNISDFSIPTYRQMTAFGKPFGLAEFGPGSPGKKAFDFDEMVHAAATAYPRMAYFMAWQDNPSQNKYFSIISNPQPEKLMNDSLIITRDRVHFSPGH